jgi:hypothetical protein
VEADGMTARAMWPRLDTAALRRLKGRADRRRLNMRLEAGIVIDPVTRMIRKGRIERRPFGVTLHLPKPLPSPNRWLRAHWRTQQRVSAAWAECIQLAALDSCPAGRPMALRTTPAGAVGWLAPPMRVRVVITKLERQPRHFITDADNLKFAGKKLLDCLVRAGFLRDDSERHIDLAVEQALTRDGLVWTVVDIAAPEVTS